MTDEVDLDATIDEVKDQIDEAEEVDFEALLEEEKNGKNRKTLVEYLERHVDDEVEVEEEDAEEEVAEQIEEETAGGLLGSFSKEAVLSAGLAGGIVLGVLFGLLLTQGPSGPSTITEMEAEQTVDDILGLQFQDYEVTGSEFRNGMFYVQSNITREVTQGNETTTQEFQQNFYVSPDGKYLFTENRQFGQVLNPINVEEELESTEESEEDSDQEDSDQGDGNTTQ